MQEEISANSDVRRLEVHEIHYYIPVYGWVKDHGNHVMVNFVKNVPAETVANAFQTPSAQSTIDMELVNHLKTLNRGEAIMLPTEQGLTDRKLKVRVGKAATAANRKLEWAQVEGGWIARVMEILPEKPSTNGAVVTQAEATTEAQTEEATTSSRNRR